MSSFAEGPPVEIEHCDFPDDLLYERDGLTWARLLDSGDVAVGITSIYVAVAGLITRIRAKPLDLEYPAGAAIGLVESAKYFGPIRAPVGGILKEVNGAVLAKPRTIVDAPYGDGWFARLHPTNRADRSALEATRDARDTLAKNIKALRVRCFAAFPDHEMFEIGVECSAVLVKLNELLAQIPIGEVVHLVTDDPTAPIEMVRWSDQTSQPVIDERKEGNLFHFLVRRAR